MRNERGFTLVEIIASLVIVTIVLISAAQLIIQTNKTAELNNEKLILINLADMTLERLKIEVPVGRITVPLPTLENKKITLPSHYEKITLNGNEYTLEAKALTDSSRIQLKLINVRVVVTSSVSKSKGTIEGLVEVP